jgi:predicted acyl esterase
LVKINAKGEEVCFYGMDGFARDMVARGWLRLSQRELDEERSQPWQPVLKHRGEKKVKPGEIMACEIEILPSSTLFAKGDTLRLVIMGRDMIGHPRISYARLVNKGALSIYAGGDYDSHLLVPAIPAKPQ